MQLSKALPDPPAGLCSLFFQMPTNLSHFVNQIVATTLRKVVCKHLLALPRGPGVLLHGAKPRSEHNEKNHQKSSLTIFSRFFDDFFDPIYPQWCLDTQPGQCANENGSISRVFLERLGRAEDKKQAQPPSTRPDFSGNFHSFSANTNNMTGRFWEFLEVSLQLVHFNLLLQPQKEPEHIRSIWTQSKRLKMSVHVGSKLAAQNEPRQCMLCSALSLRMHISAS